MQTIKLVAPGKVNLFLGIGQRREDGYHDATTVMHALAMHDKIEMTRLESGEEASLLEPGDAAQPVRQFDVSVSPGSGLVVGANIQWRAGLDPLAISDEDNLACKAVHALAAELGRTEDEVIRLVIEKSIPHRTGLGGGSSDAAAALVGAAFLWGLSADDVRVETTAQKLGADVAFFLHGGCALLEGTGNQFVHSLTPSKQTVVVIKPAGGVSTVEAYAAFDTEPEYVADELLSSVREAQDAREISLYNNLAPASERLHGELATVRSFASSFNGVSGVLLCGSGAGTFALCETYEVGQALSTSAQAHGWWARCTSLTSLAASVLP